MKITFRVLCVMGLVVAASVLGAADAPYIGKWKLNPAKSQLAGVTASIEQTPDGFMHYQQGDLGFTFKLNGMEYPTPDGGTTSWKAVDANTWEITNRVKVK